MNIYQKLRSSYEKTYKTVNHFILYFDVIYSAKQTITLFERPWITTEINGKFIEVDSPNRPAIYFDAKNKRFAGADGCNKIQDSFDSNNQHLKLGQIASTLMACHGAQDTISREYNDALAQTNRYEVKGHELKFLDKSGQTLVKFVTVIQPLPFKNRSCLELEVKARFKYGLLLFRQFVYFNSILKN